MRALVAFILAIMTIMQGCEASSDAKTAVEKTAKLVIISPHRKSIQREVIPVFKKYYRETFGREIEVDWIDQGGTENDLRYIRAKFNTNPLTTDIDVFWGGGDLTFHDLEREGMLAPHALPLDLARQLPVAAVGVPLRSSQNHWYASALSSFGIFYNRRLLQMLGQEEPKNWQDLGHPRFHNYLSMVDPRHSSSALVMDLIILNALGWERGWQTLAAIAGNTKHFTHISTDPIKAVVTGEASAAAAIDFYALAKIGDVGEKNLGFVLPPGETVFNSDPIAVLKGAPHPQEAHRFIDFVLSERAQKLLLLPAGHKEGPRFAVLGRLAINRLAYVETEGERISALNPFTMPPPSFQLDMAKVSAIKRIFSDLMGAVQVDPHGDLKLAWEKILAQGADAAMLKRFGEPPISAATLEDLAGKWHDQRLRNRTINAWTAEALARYRQIVEELDKKSA